MIFTCKICGETLDGFPIAHYREVHPGESSPAPSHKKKRSGAKKPARQESAGADLGEVTAPADNPSLFAGNEVPPDLPPGIEATPVEPEKRSWRDRFWRGGNADVSRETSRERRPARKRENASELLALGWGGLGLALIKTGADDPVGRCLQFQAPVAGEVLDKLIAGTVVDRAIVQPIARNADQAEAATALFALPLLVFAWERASLEGRVVLYPLMQEAVRANFVAMVPVMKRKKLEARKFADAVQDMKAEGMLPDEVDAESAVDAILGAMLNGVSDEQPASNGQVRDDSLAR